MKFHPLTHILVSIELAAILLILPAVHGFIACALWLFLSLVMPNRTATRLTPVFIKLLFVAAFFLFLIHGISLRELSISIHGIMAVPDSFIHIATPVAAIIYLSRNIRLEELYALLLDLRIPPVIIFILFRTLWLVPRFVERIDEVITAQKLRGMRIEKIPDRFRALIPTLGPIFSSMIEEISENSLTLTARGFLGPGDKTHVTPLSYSRADIMYAAAASLVFIFIVF
jgi:energy-coupling factor transporter transmembrane protein EcfT